MTNFPKTLCEELQRTFRSKEWKGLWRGNPPELTSVPTVTRAFRSSALREDGFTYNQGIHEWDRREIEVFMQAVRMTCQGRTIRVGDDHDHLPEHKAELIFLTPHKAVCRLLKQRSRSLVCEALDAVEVLGMLTHDD